MFCVQLSLYCHIFIHVCCVNFYWSISINILQILQISLSTVISNTLNFLLCCSSIYYILENVAIANALQLGAARATPALSRFNDDAMPSLKSLHSTYPLPYIAFLLLIHYFTLGAWHLTLWPWPMTFHLEHLQCIACDVMKLERNQAIRGAVITISVFDLMTLNMCYVLRWPLG